MEDIVAIVLHFFASLRRRRAAAYMAGSLETVAHAILSSYAVYLYSFVYGCGCTYRVTLRVVN